MDYIVDDGAGHEIGSSSIPKSMEEYIYKHMHEYMPNNNAVPGIGLLKDELKGPDKEILKDADANWRSKGVLKKFN